ncbi:MAG TPA: SRPBCC domain-containing protein [Terriglobales bacterium]|nr:SRPBCC domain-containing protein [Terriglobales bacterium]
MATVGLSPNQDTVTAEIRIAAPPERVFAAITDPQQVTKWWGQQNMYKITHWQNDLRPGGKWRSEGSGADGKVFHVEGEYVEVDPPRLLIHTWNPSYRDLPTTVVRWELQEYKGGTLVKLTHSGFGGHADAAKDHSQGWTRVLVWMEAFVEDGATVETRAA